MGPADRRATIIPGAGKKDKGRLGGSALLPLKLKAVGDHGALLVGFPLTLETV